MDPGTDTRYDVAIAGYGPVGAVLANLLGGLGRRVLVVEREPSVYHLPRAAHFDHEIMRVFETIGLAEEIEAGTAPIAGMHFLNADGAFLFGSDIPDQPEDQGWRRSYLFHQPELELALRRGVARHACVDVLLEHDVVGFNDDGPEVRIEVLDRHTGETREVTASFLVGCDGARSTVRRQAGIALEDLGFDEPWLVTDVLLREPVDLPVHSIQYCDPARPTTYVPMPDPRRRWEFMLRPGETAETMEQPSTVLGLLTPWLRADQCEVERARVYVFHAIVARGWRSGRVLVAGDAAHQMPPFLGQGMCSGIRDAANLAWKLDMVLGGLAPVGLLDTYESERAPHVRQIIDTAVSIGGVICTQDPAEAAARDAFFLGDGARPPRTDELTPPLGPGVVGPGTAAGTRFPQPLLRLAGGDRRLDGVIGYRFALLVRPGPALAVAPGTRRTLGALGGVIVDQYVEPPGQHDLASWFDAHGADAVVVRPDRYVFATASGATASATVVDALERAISRA